VQRAVYSGVLLRAAEILGGPEALVDYLGVPPARLAAWLRGEGDPPADVFLRSVDIVVEHNLKGLLTQLHQQAGKSTEA
jgi:hypothetical protein